MCRLYLRKGRQLNQLGRVKNTASEVEVEIEAEIEVEAKVEVEIEIEGRQSIQQSDSYRINNSTIQHI